MHLSLFRQLLPVCLLAAISACTPQLAYQVLETHTPAPAAADPTLSLAYNFWNEDGRVLCTVTNTTEAPVYLDLSRSQLIVNGAAEDYYQDEELTTTTAVATRSTYSRLSSTSTQRASSQLSRPKPIRQVPPHAAIVVGGLSAVSARVLACELEKWRTRTPATLTFTEADSPLKFRQFLTYSRRPDGSDARTLDNAFWVERVSNMSAESFNGPSVRDERCGKKLMTTHKTLPYAKAGNLYVAFRSAL